MSVYHCPLCPLIFQYRTEVDWHLREEHRSRADEDADLRSELADASGGELDWLRLRALRSSIGHPSVTLLMATTPAATMTMLDVARLRYLTDRARRRLPAEPERATPAAILEHRLARLVAAAEGSATDRGLAILVNEHDMGIFRLPLEPRDRAVVDPGFATRDLEYALRRYPRYRVLLLNRVPRVLEGRGRQLAVVDTATGEGQRRVGWGRRDADEHEVERLLDHRVSTAGVLPLVVVGDSGSLTDFRRRSRHFPAVIGEAHRSRLRATAGVAELAEQALERWHHEQQARTVAELYDAEVHDEVAWGLPAVWHAVETGVADHLWVEHGFALPGRDDDDLGGVEATGDPAEPGVFDDLIDVLLARAAQQGIPIDVLDDHALQRSDPVAARVPDGLRSPTGPPGVLNATAGAEPLHGLSTSNGSAG
jgi:hypothetical protein